MSEGQDSYRVREVHGPISTICPFAVLDHAEYTATGRVVDIYRSRSAADYAARLLNRGLARVDSHAVVGCRVVAS